MPRPRLTVAEIIAHLPGPTGKGPRSQPAQAVALARLGLTVTTVWVALALIPAGDEPGEVVYPLGTRRGHDRR